MITVRSTHEVAPEAVLETFTTDLRGLVARAQGGEVVRDGRGLGERQLLLAALELCDDAELLRGERIRHVGRAAIASGARTISSMSLVLTFFALITISSIPG